MTFEEARAQFPVLERVAYLNAGTFGPLATATAAAIDSELGRDTAEGRAGQPYYARVLDLRDELRAALAALVGVRPGNVALATSTTDACNVVLGGLALGEDDEVITTTDEHFGLLGALGASCARVVVVEPDADAIADAVTARTRLLALSHVLWTTGRVLPVVELRKRTGVPVLVDGAQSVGAIPVDARGMDFLTISGQKWLCGPDSTGALVVAEPENLRVAAPSYFSQSAYRPDGSFDPREGAARFEGGWWSAGSLAGLLAALATRPAWAFERAAATADRCRSLLSEQVEVIEPRTRSTIVTFRPATADAAGLVERLRLEGVHVREIPGTGLVRASCGWWTSEDDLARLASSI